MLPAPSGVPLRLKLAAYRLYSHRCEGGNLVGATFVGVSSVCRSLAALVGNRVVLVMMSEVKWGLPAAGRGVT